MVDEFVRRVDEYLLVIIEHCLHKPVVEDEERETILLVPLANV